MENSKQNSRVLVAVLSALLVLVVAGGAYYWNNSQKLTRQNDRIEQQSDSLLSAKLRLEGDIRSLENQLEEATDENTSLNERLSGINDRLGQRNQVVNDLRQVISKRQRTMQALNRTLSNLNSSKDSLENQMRAVVGKVNWLTDSTRVGNQQNVELQQRISDLTGSLLNTVPRSALTADAFLVETTKSNRKETAKAKKVNALTISLNVPAEMQLKDVQDVYLSLTDSLHNPMTSPLKQTTVTFSTNNEVIPVHAVKGIEFGLNPQRISFTITPETTIKPGKYRASVFTKDVYLGSVEFQLRDSFWFFLITETVFNGCSKPFLSSL